MVLYHDLWSKWELWANQDTPCGKATKLKVESLFFRLWAGNRDGRSSRLCSRRQTRKKSNSTFGHVALGNASHLNGRLERMHKTNTIHCPVHPQPEDKSALALWNCVPFPPNCCFGNFSTLCYLLGSYGLQLSNDNVAKLTPSQKWCNIMYRYGSSKDMMLKMDVMYWKSNIGNVRDALVI